MHGFAVGVSVASILILPPDASTPTHALLQSSPSIIISGGCIIASDSIYHVPRCAPYWRRYNNFSLRAIAENTITRDTDEVSSSSSSLDNIIPNNFEVEDPNSYLYPAHDNTRLNNEENNEEVSVAVDYDEILFHAGPPNAVRYLSLPCKHQQQHQQLYQGEENLNDEILNNHQYARKFSINSIEMSNELSDYDEDTQSDNTVDDSKRSEEGSNSEAENNSYSSSEEDEPSGADDSSSTIKSAIAKSTLLHRAGITGSAKRKSSSSNRRSSRAKTHVNKSSRRVRHGGAMGRVLGTVRTAAAAAAIERERISSPNEEQNTRGNNDNLTASYSSPLIDVKQSRLSSTLKSTIESTVAGMLQKQEVSIQQQLQQEQNYHSSRSTVSMGLLGEPITDESQQLPPVPPLPGSFLVGTNGDIPSKRQMIIRSSIPHSSDDTHIANLRLSVFSNFDEEKQNLFRSRSVEVLNVRRKKGAVVLVAEIPKKGGEGHNDYLNEMQARIANGYQYGNCMADQTNVDESTPHALIVRPGRGARVTSVSTGVTVDNSSIIGSVECSSQEFRGTILGNSRPTGSVMYVTEVAVSPDARRAGAGVMLMQGVDKVAALRNIETIYLHVDVKNKAAGSMYEKCGYTYLDKKEAIYAQFTASLNLHDGALHGRKHYLMCKNVSSMTTWIDQNHWLEEGLGLLG